jgi:hypothetical protein
MTFLPQSLLPKSAEAREDLLEMLVAIPLTLVGTAFLIFLAATGSFVAM